MARFCLPSSLLASLFRLYQILQSNWVGKAWCYKFNLAVSRSNNFVLLLGDSACYGLIVPLCLLLDLSFL